MPDRQQRFPIRRGLTSPGALNIERDVHLARDRYGPRPPALGPSIEKARQALCTQQQGQIGDNVEELDNRLIDARVAIDHVLAQLRTAFPHLAARHGS